jgi:hypothetical protein
MDSRYRSRDVENQSIGLPPPTKGLRTRIKYCRRSQRILRGRRIAQHSRSGFQHPKSIQTKVPRLVVSRGGNLSSVIVPTNSTDLSRASQGRARACSPRAQIHGVRAFGGAGSDISRQTKSRELPARPPPSLDRPNLQFAIDGCREQFTLSHFEARHKIVVRSPPP